MQTFCRPRFFAGQLLTEQDLNRLDRYVVEKQRLHNRYLHGWGTVCGLSVRCDPCGEGVVVSSGYALSPCGNDIVLACNETVDVCALIDACREEAVANCQPPYPRKPDGCDDDAEEWILAICYEEKKTRGISALHQSPSCCGGKGCGDPGCACGGAASAGCGCEPKTFEPPPVQCEPTLVCETHRYMVYREDEVIGLLGLSGDDAWKPPTPRITEAFWACVRELIEALSAEPDTDDADRRYGWLCAIQERMWRFFATHPFGSCDWKERLEGIHCPKPHSPQFPNGYAIALLEIVLLFIEYLFHCICEALLPPCPEPPKTDCVPLARVRVSRGECRVLHTCNWITERPIVVTFPTLGYWLEPLGIVPALRGVLEVLCCGIHDLRGLLLDALGLDLTHAALSSSAPAGRVAEAAAQRLHTLSLDPALTERPRQVLSMTLKAIFSDTGPPDPVNLFNRVLRKPDADGKDALTPDEHEHLMEYVLAQFAAGPLAKGALPRELAGLFGLARGLASEDDAGISGLADHEAGGGTADLAAMRAEIGDLRATVSALQRQVHDLQGGGG